MQSISEPLAQLHDDLGWFVRAREISLMVVHCSAELRGPIVDLLPRYEFHHDNRGAWIVLEDAHTRSDDGWVVRTNRLEQHWDRRRTAAREDGLELAPLVTEPRPRRGREAFATTCNAVASALRPPLVEATVVLAPTIIDDARAFTADIDRILGGSVPAVRLIVVAHDDRPGLADLVRSLGPRGLVCRCAVDGAQQHRDLHALLASGETHRERFGMAGPTGVSPPGVEPTATDTTARDAALRQAGIDPAYLEQAPRLRQHVFTAALAMKDGDGATAVAHQRSAAMIAAALGLGQIEVICRITLASYLSGSGHRAAAISELEAVSVHATAVGLTSSVGQAQLALGLLHALGRDHVAAVRAYTRAAQATEQAGDTLLAVECWRLAGQLSLEAGHTTSAIASFQRAIALAENTDAPLARHSSAGEAARRLAKLCRQRGLQAHADSLEAQADRLEAVAIPEGA